MTYFEWGWRSLGLPAYHQAAYWFERAIEENPIPGGPRYPESGMNYRQYLPHYYAGVAYFGAENFEQSLKKFEEAEYSWDLAKSTKLHVEAERENIKLARSIIQRLRSLQDKRKEIENLPRKENSRREASEEANLMTEILLGIDRQRRYLFNTPTDFSSYKNIAQFFNKRLAAVDSTLLDLSKRLTALHQQIKERSYVSRSLPRARFALHSARDQAQLSMRTVSATTVKITENDYNKIASAYHKRAALLLAPHPYTYWTDTEPAQSFDQIEYTLRLNGFCCEDIDRKVGSLNSTEILNAVKSFIDKHAEPKKERNLVLIFMLGHGLSVTKAGQGSRDSTQEPTTEALLLDAEIPNIPELSNVDYPISLNSLSQKTQDDIKKKSINLLDLVGPAKSSYPHHIVFFFESCYSGALLRNGEFGPYNSSNWHDSLFFPGSGAPRGALIAMTSSAANEATLKAGVDLPLSEAIVRAFQGCAPRGARDIVHGRDLIDWATNQVKQRFRLNPQSGRLRGTFGDFLLILKNNCRQPTEKNRSQPTQATPLPIPEKCDPRMNEVPACPSSS